MNSVIVENDRYTVDTLYQWDKNQTLKIVGLAIASIPEIHFTTEAMDRAIVRQASKDDVGIITVDVPNSLLQKPYTIKAYICIYEGETFKTEYAINIPIKARKKPNDYTLENDVEVYSFNALENLVNNTLVEANRKYDEAISQSKADYDSAIAKYNEVSSILDDLSGYDGDLVEMINTKSNKASVTVATLSTSKWVGNIYSFETEYPVNTYDIEIALNSTATVDQVNTFNSAQIVGSATTNTVKAFGTIPTIDIPIIIKAVKK